MEGRGFESSLGVDPGGGSGAAHGDDAIEGEWLVCVDVHCGSGWMSVDAGRGETVGAGGVGIVVDAGAGLFGDVAFDELADVDGGADGAAGDGVEIVPGQYALAQFGLGGLVAGSEVGAAFVSNFDTAATDQRVTIAGVGDAPFG
jgi:hypothetical protein